eukprot:TRINITY_DN1813_c4_g1_i1.p1 TRINITY_DN1813_c4_g1~~TRINITY_DN1813_c4_g1_i1.p1  ORF type:complete len:172 (+),score=35.77 TRINITY_DN1813_c4_g1_i1:124-639(+)
MAAAWEVDEWALDDGNYWAEDSEYDSAWDEHCYPPYDDNWLLPRCRNGISCHFLAMGTCKYRHPELEDDYDEQSYEQSSASSGPRSRRWNVLVVQKPEQPSPEPKVQEQKLSPTSSTKSSSSVSPCESRRRSRSRSAKRSQSKVAEKTEKATPARVQNRVTLTAAAQKGGC